MLTHFTEQIPGDSELAKKYLAKVFLFKYCDNKGMYLDHILNLSIYCMPLYPVSLLYIMMISTHL